MNVPKSVSVEWQPDDESFVVIVCRPESAGKAMLITLQEARQLQKQLEMALALFEQPENGAHDD